MALKRLRSYDISLNAGVDYNLNVDGNIFFAASNSSVYSLRFDDENLFQSVKVGAKINFDSSYRRITLTSATTQNVRVIAGYGDFDNTVESVLAFLIPASILDPISDVTIGATATLIAAQDSTRREIALTLLDTATAGIRIGDSGVTATKGLLLVPGTTVFIGTSAAIYGIRTGSSDETLTALEIS